MTYPPSLKAAMTPFPYSVDIEATLREAKQLMTSHSVHHLPVTQDHKVIGILTAHALDTAMGSLEGQVKDIPTPAPYVVDLNESIDTVLLDMADRHIDAVIILRQGRLAGVFTWTDACRAFGDYIRAVFPRPNDGGAA